MILRIDRRVPLNKPTTSPSTADQMVADFHQITAMTVPGEWCVELGGFARRRQSAS